jgi:lipoprotein NlpI
VIRLLALLIALGVSVVEITEVMTTDRTDYSTPLAQIIAMSQQADAHALNTEHDQAIAVVTNALDQIPDDYPAIQAILLTQRGRLRLYLYEWDAVRADYDAALALAPDYAPAYFYRGVLMYSVLTDRIPRETALADFQMYLQLAPNGRLAATATHYRDILQAEIEALDS